MPKTIQDRFFKDPEWYQVEELIMKFINPLLEMNTIDTTQPAEAVKAEVIARRMSYETLMQFLNQSKIIGHSRPKVENSPFK